MKEAMYKRSKVRFDNAQYNLEKAIKGGTIDDAYFDTACFDAQQAVEFILKAILLEYNVEFEFKGNEGHNILALTELVIERTTFRFAKIEDLENLATTITMWETQSRYHTGIRTKANTVRRVLNIYKSIDYEFTKILNAQRVQRCAEVSCMDSFSNAQSIDGNEKYDVD